MQTIKGIFNEKINEKAIYDAVISRAEYKKARKPVMRYALVPACIAILCGVLIFNDAESNEPLKDNHNNIIVNEYAQDISAGERLKIDAEIKYAGEVDAIGYVDLMDIKVPEELSNIQVSDAYTKDDKTGVYNIFAWHNYTYTNEQNNKWITMNFSDKDRPARCYTFEGGQMSNINGIEVGIYKYESAFIALFEYNDVYYDIETEGISEGALVEMISSIIG